MRTTRVFWIDGEQAVTVPADFQFADDEVYIKRMSNAVVLLPIEGSWQPLIDSLGKFSSDFMETRDQPESRERESIEDWTNMGTVTGGEG